MKTAIKSNYFNEFANVKALQETKGKDPDQQALASLSNHSGWKVLEAYIKRVMEELDDMTKTQMVNGVPFEEIGRSTVVKEIVKDALRRIIRKVGDAAEARDTEGATG